MESLITGCDTSGKFNYKSKEHWVNLFLKYSNDLMKALFEFQHSFKLCKVLEKFIFMGYLKEKENAMTSDKVDSSNVPLHNVKSTWCFCETYKSTYRLTHALRQFQF